MWTTTDSLHLLALIAMFLISVAAVAFVSVCAWRIILAMIEQVSAAIRRGNKGDE